MFIFNVMAPGTLGHRQFWTCSFATVQNITIRIPEILQALQFAARCWARTGNASGDVIMTLPKFSKWFTWKCMLSKRKESPFFQDAIVRWTPCQTLGGYVAFKTHTLPETNNKSTCFCGCLEDEFVLFGSYFQGWAVLFVLFKKRVSVYYKSQMSYTLENWHET